jgi:hypothetical protein
LNVSRSCWDCQHVEYSLLWTCGGPERYVIRSMMTTNATSPPRKRRRPPQSCDECRRRKVKCDRAEPCGRCILFHKHCRYGNARSSPKATYNERVNTFRASERLSRAEYEHPFRATSSEFVISTTTPPGSGLSTAPTCSVSATHLQVADANGVATSVSEPQRTVHTESSSFHSDVQRLSLNKSRYFGGSHWTNHTLVEVYLSFRIVST